MILYRYRDLSDGIIKYIGIVWGKERNLKQRANEHYKENRFKRIDWEISYIEIDLQSRTDAEYFESHYIAYYNTDKWLNIKKSGWGISSFVPTFEESEWKIYNHIFIDDELENNPPEITAQELIDVFLSYKDKQRRKALTCQIKGKTYVKSVSSEYWIKVRDLMNIYINNKVLIGSRLKFRITPLGEIITELPFFGKAYYRDYSDSFYILSTKEEIKRSIIVCEAERRFSEMFNALKII